MRFVIALLLVGALGTGAFFHQTRGWRFVTTESARRDDVARQPRGVPDVLLGVADAGRDSLLHLLHSDGRVTIVNFIYTRCVSVCLAMGSEYQQLQKEILERGLERRVRLLSLSFDPADTGERLAAYGKRMNADARVWTFAMPVRAEERRALLRTFGIVVVPAELGEFEHNAAYHVVTADGRLTRIMDLGLPRMTLDYALAQGGKPALSGIAP